MSGKPGAGHIVEEPKKDGLLMGQLRKLINIIVRLATETLIG